MKPTQADPPGVVDEGGLDWLFLYIQQSLHCQEEANCWCS